MRLSGDCSEINLNVYFYPDSIRNPIQRFLEYLSELSTLRISYPQF